LVDAKDVAIACEEYDGIAVLTVSGEFADEQTGAARRQVEKMTDQRSVVKFVVDFADCSFVASDGLETLLWLKTRCEQSYGHLKLARCDQNLEKILEMTRLQRRFDTTDDLEKALKLMRV